MAIWWTGPGAATKPLPPPPPLRPATALRACSAYVVAVEDSSDAHLLSPDHLGVDVTGHPTVIIRFQNHTPAEQMRLRFTTEADGNWDDAKSRSFTVVANDNGSRTDSLDMSAVAAWKGRLRQLRLDLAAGKPLTGTCRIDYLWIISAAAGQ